MFDHATKTDDTIAHANTVAAAHDDASPFATAAAHGPGLKSEADLAAAASPFEHLAANDNAYALAA
jgi:hypothetical protein